MRYVDARAEEPLDHQRRSPSKVVHTLDDIRCMYSAEYSLPHPIFRHTDLVDRWSRVQIELDSLAPKLRRLRLELQNAAKDDGSEFLIDGETLCRLLTSMIAATDWNYRI